MRQLVPATVSHILPWVGSLALCAIGCGSPTAPSQMSAPAASGPWGRPFTPVEIGEVVRTQVTAADVPCDSFYHCKYFGLTTPRAGTLEMGLTHAPGAIYGPPTSSPIDMWVSRSGGGVVWMDNHYPDVEAYARITATAGETFLVQVVSYEMPGVTFQLRFSLVP